MSGCQVGTAKSQFLRHVLVDDVGGDLQGHSPIRVLSHVLPERGTGHVQVLSRGDRVDQPRARLVPLPNREGVVVVASGCEKGSSACSLRFSSSRRSEYYTKLIALS
jgi:hypothetical protein